MTGKPQSELPLAIDQIVHRAVIEVAEAGDRGGRRDRVAVAVRSVRAGSARHSMSTGPSCLPSSMRKLARSCSKAGSSIRVR